MLIAMKCMISFAHSSNRERILHLQYRLGLGNRIPLNQLILLSCSCILQVYLKSRFIMNGVCVMWRGWLHLQRLDGAGCMEFDDDRAQVRTGTRESEHEI